MLLWKMNIKKQEEKEHIEDKEEEKQEKMISMPEVCENFDFTESYTLAENSVTWR